MIVFRREGIVCEAVAAERSYRQQKALAALVYFGKLVDLAIIILSYDCKYESNWRNKLQGV